MRRDSLDVSCIVVSVIALVCAALVGWLGYTVLMYVDLCTSVACALFAVWFSPRD